MFEGIIIINRAFAALVREDLNCKHGLKVILAKLAIGGKFITTKICHSSVISTNGQLDMN